MTEAQYNSIRTHSLLHEEKLIPKNCEIIESFGKSFMIRDVNTDRSYEIQYIFKGLSFYDIDGCLSIPMYDNESYKDAFGNKTLVPGFSKLDWEVKTMQYDDMYEHCVAPEVFKEMIRKDVENAIQPHIITTEAWCPAMRSKINFIKKNYPEIEQDYIYWVPNDNEKIKMMDFIRQYRYSHEYDKCVYWDDSYSLVLEALEAGYRAHHVSELLYGGD